MKTVSFATLGCKVNQYETEAMANLFEKSGYEIRSFDDVCDIYIINTCTVTGMGDRKSRQMISRASRCNPDALIAVVGCYSQVAPDDIKKLDSVGLVLGTKERKNIVIHCENAIKSKQKTVIVTDIMKERSYEEISVTSYSSKTRAFVKIEDGCTEFCTYCIIPYARGPVRSRSLTDITNEVGSLSQNGFSEIVLTGIHLSSYGKDTRTHTLLDVIKEVSKNEGIKRIRLGSLEPRILTEDFVREISGIPKLCNHFHVALQSGCNATLSRMNRKYTREEYLNSILLLRKYFDNPAIATDIMVGFPGETEEEFNDSLEFARSLKLYDAHVFAYSNRKGTKADRMPSQVPKSIKEKRSRMMISSLRESKKKFLTAHIGKSCSVLFEQMVSPSVYEGHTTDYITVHTVSDTDLSGKFVSVTLTGTDGQIMTAVSEQKA